MIIILIAICIITAGISYYNLIKPSSTGYYGLTRLIVSCFGTIILVIIEAVVYIV